MREETMSNRQSQDQLRATRAWADVNDVDKSETDSFKKDYRSLARKTAANLQSSGLGQAMSFLRSKAGPKGSDEHRKLYQHVSRWVMAQMDPAQDRDSLLEWVIQQNSLTYRRATVEAIAYLGWLKRFAEAVLPEK